MILIATITIANGIAIFMPVDLSRCNGQYTHPA